MSAEIIVLADRREAALTKEFERLTDILIANRHKIKPKDFDAGFAHLAKASPAERDLVEALRRRLFD